MLNILVWIARSKHDIGNGFVVALKLFFFSSSSFYKEQVVLRLRSD